MKRWKVTGRIVAIYSSGSVLAQKLIFKYSDQGDLSPFIDRYFDTNTGPKRESGSYRKIAQDLAINSEDIIFVSDVYGRADAADQAGMQSALSVRAGNAVIAESHSFRTIVSFDDIE